MKHCKPKYVKMLLANYITGFFKVQYLKEEVNGQVEFFLLKNCY